MGYIVDWGKQCLKCKALINKYHSCMIDTAPFLFGMGLLLGEVNILNGKARLFMKARLSFALVRPRLQDV